MREQIVWVQESPQETIRRRVSSAIDVQWEDVQRRSLKPHDPSCIEPTFCTKMNCFEWASDTIVSDPYDIELIKRLK